MTAKMEEIQWLVVTKCCCMWEIFLENVRGSGWTMSRLESAAEECETERDFMKLINNFI